MRELAVQAANGTNQSSDRDNLQKEFAELQAEVKRLIDQTKFNNTQVLKGGTQTFQVGANTGETISVTGTDLTSTTASKVQLAATSGISITGADATNATAAITALDLALTEVNTERSLYGAAQSRFESAISSLQVNVENQAAARSRIMDADYAAETAALTRAQILQQAGVAMLAQANAMPQNVLALLRG
jgi:flagellin